MLPKASRAALTPQEIEFIAENQLITVVPTRAISDKFELLSGEYGPFRPPLKSKVPLWLALSLKRKGKCTIVPPVWLDAEYLEAKLEEERSSPGFTDMPFLWLETANLLTKHAQDDITNYEQVRNFIKSIKECRGNKAIAGLKYITIDLFSQGFLNLDNLGLMEVNEIKPFFAKAFDEMGKFSGALATDK
ncbi:DNA replication complex GINS protein PSF2 [Obelidium mucronatum]|nr:DNA replication complex GINS protein PSF2 [Obelidium mucronatum]